MAHEILQRTVGFVVLLSLVSVTLVADRGAPVRTAVQRSQGLFAGKSSRWSVLLKATESCPGCPAGVAFVFEVEDKISRQVSSFRVANQTSQVAEVIPIGASKALVLGTSAAGDVATVVALPSGRVLDSFLCAGPSISPDHRFLAFVKWRPAHLPPDVEVSNEYLVYDLLRDAGFNRPAAKRGVKYDAGWAIYPPGATNAELENLVHGAAIAEAHALISPLLWLDGKNLLTFVDRSGGAIRLVLADVAEGVNRVKVRALPLDTRKIVDLSSCQNRVAPSDFKKWSEDPAQLVFVTAIATSLQSPGSVRLEFSPQPCVLAKTLDVRLKG